MREKGDHGVAPEIAPGNDQDDNGMVRGNCRGALAVEGVRRVRWALCARAMCRAVAER